MEAKTNKKGGEEKVTHPNIYAALAAFQAEAPEIKKTKRFGKEDEKMSFMYASLDDVLEVVRPITSKHGLSFTWEKGSDDSKLVCVLYHETYSREMEEKTETVTRTFGDSEEVVMKPIFTEKNVLRSMPVEVARKGDMKTIGNNSTYARRYTICEVLGLAAEEDKDATDVAKQSSKNAQAFAFTKAKQGIEGAKTKEALEKAMKMVEDDVKKLEGGRAPSLGLQLEQYNELRNLGEVKYKELLDEEEQR